MTRKYVCLDELIKLINNEEVSHKYINYICGIENNKEYRHQEIIDIHSLLSAMSIDSIYKEGFIYGYIIPQLNKEFDLLKITKKSVINIELKSQPVTEIKIKDQLLKNRYYLKMLNKENLILFTWISSSSKLYLLKNDEISECSVSELEKVLKDEDVHKINLDDYFSAKNILVSPSNSPERFLEDKYLLTESQFDIKEEIINYIEKTKESKFIRLTGNPGTGKTLLIYDIAKELAHTKKIIIIHSGKLSDGLIFLGENINNLSIITAKESNTYNFKDVDVVIVDEAHRIYDKTLEKIVKWTDKTRNTCIFSYDKEQKLSIREKNMKNTDIIEELCKNHSHKLQNKIRTNKEVASFIDCLRDTSKYKQDDIFNNIKIYFEKDKQSAVEFCLKLEKEGYKYISYTASYYVSVLDFQISSLNTHDVIGQEFDKVCMFIDDNFYYKNNKLRAKKHPNPDYLYDQLLYQGLTRARNSIALVITDINILERILPMFQIIN